MDATDSLTHPHSKADRVFEKSLHAVRKGGGTPLKPWKKPTAPLPPQPSNRVYKVAAIDFKEIVQKLTGAGPGNPRRLQDAAPPSLEVASAEARAVSERYKGGNNALKERDANMTISAGSPMTPLSAFFRELSGSGDISGHGARLELGLSPSTTQGWLQYPISSPGGGMKTSTFL
ncbi:hypothetical protein MLD38_031372 [Melastoma candidum]|uniref:Uncharacterized protein n=1 Tax=Melastoma candidum TaxID=119954 RepID=A0ACB9MRD7_9MYRT|nr:hypothetical protein MLD38_031372 [Melastoma candidum]